MNDQMKPTQSTTSASESPVRKALRVIGELEQKLHDLQHEPIAVVGMGCRMPGGGETPRAFWDFLLSGRDGVGDVPPERWDGNSLFDPDPYTPGTYTSKRGGFIDDITRFDAGFFNISNREAESLDPQQRLLLEVSHEAFEDAGMPHTQIAGKRGGVYIGILTFDYTVLRMADMNTMDAYATTGMALSTAVGRLSYYYDLHGPSIAMDGACSSSLLALHHAAHALRRRDIDFAVTGGVNAILSPYNHVLMTKLQTLSPDGRCKVFDHRADGYVRAEGCGLMVLQRLSDARASGKRIHAVLTGSAVSQDGRSNGLTAPNGLAQEAMMREALKDAGVKPETIGLLETHGTGTALGDPIEMDAIKAVYGEVRTDRSRIFVGALKSNIGHLEPAAGAAGIIKCALAMKHGRVPPNLHFEKLNPHIDIKGTPVHLPTRAEEWPASPGIPRRAAVSAFGVNGSIAHAILEQAPEQESPSLPDEPGAAHTLHLSARGEPALHAMAHTWKNFLAQTPHTTAEICRAAALQRTHFENRLSLSATTKEELVQGLDDFLAETRAHGLYHGEAAEMPPRLVFLYSGQGPAFWPVHAELLQDPVIEDMLGRCDETLQKLGGWSLLEQLQTPPETSLLPHNQYSQPALFAIQAALTAWWKDQGIQPHQVIGHSMGEVAAAYAAGALDLEDALTVIHHRGRLVQSQCGKGKMAYVERSVEAAEEAIAEHREILSVAVENGPRAVVLSGDPQALTAVIERLEAEDVFCKIIESVNFASHSPQMDAIREQMTQAVSGIKPRAGLVPFYSTAQGSIMPGHSLDPAYWGLNLRARVRFHRAVRETINQGPCIFLEISPHPALTGATRQILEDLEQPPAVIGSLHREARPAVRLMGALGGLHVYGHPLDLPARFPEKGPHLDLPLYPWQKQDFPLWPRQHKKSQEVAKRVSNEAESEAVIDLIAIPTNKRESHLREWLAERVARIMRLPVEQLRHNKSLKNMGLDSLMAMDLRKQAQAALGVGIPVTRLMRGAALDDLVSLICAELPKNQTSSQIQFAGSPLEATIAGLIQRVAGKPPALEMPRDYPPNMASLLSAELGFAVDPDLLHKAPSITALAQAVENRHIARRDTDWFRTISPKAEAKLKLYCFPFLGGGASFCRDFADIHPQIEVTGIQFPGHEERLFQTPYDRFNDALEALAKAFRSSLGDTPFAFYGHSLGALYAFELARKLTRESGPKAEALLLAAQAAPGQVASNAWLARFNHANAAELIRDANDQVVQDAQIQNILLPSLRAGLSAFHSYAYRKSTPLDIPVTLFTGDADPIFETTDPHIWSAVTSAPFTHFRYKGDHFYPSQHASSFAAYLREATSQVLTNAGQTGTTTVKTGAAS